MASAQPKKPASAYFLYITEHRESIEKAVGAKKASEVAKKAGEQWKALSEAERKPYEERAQAKKASYDKALEEFKAGGGVVTRKSKKIKSRIMIKNPEAPKRLAGGAYGVWLNEHREEIKKSLPNGHKFTDVTKAAGEKWKALAEDDKKVYKEKYDAKSEEYKKEVEDFKAAGGQTKVEKRPPMYGEESAAMQRKRPFFKRKGKDNKAETRAEKRKKEDDAALAAIDRMRASRSIMVGA